MTRENLPRWATAIVLSLLGVILLTGLSFAISDRVSLGNEVKINTNDITRLKSQQETTQRTLDKMDGKLDRIIDCQAKIQSNKPC